MEVFHAQGTAMVVEVGGARALFFRSIITATAVASERIVVALHELADHHGTRNAGSLA